MSAQLYQHIAQTILTTLNNGVRPWEACYSITRHHYPIRITGDAYRGINRITLLTVMLNKGYRNPLWLTFNQATRLGARVRRGEKSTLSLFFKPIERRATDDAEEVHTVWLARANRVFNAEQVRGLPAKLLETLLPAQPTVANQPQAQAEAFIQSIPALTRYHDGTPAFNLSRDVIYMPALQHFKSSAHYYATFLHELAHWSGHPSRLNRPSLVERQRDNYYREELCAELTASFLCPSLGIEPLIDEEHAPYLQHYIQLLEHDPKAFVHACSQAEKAADYLHSLQPQ